MNVRSWGHREKTDRLLFSISRIEGDGDGAVVYERDLHVGGKNAGLYQVAKRCAECLDDVFVEGFSFLGICCVVEGGSVSFLGGGDQRELAYDQQFTLDRF